MHGDIDATDVTRGGRLRVMGAQHIPPMVTRGVLLDIPAVLGVNRLAPGYGVTAEDVRRALGKKTLESGDVALVRTGWMQLYKEGPAFHGQEGGVPGVTGEAAEWLAEHGVVAVGSDTTAFAQIVPDPAFLARPAPPASLPKHGVHLLALLDLEELAREGVSEFLFVMTPLKLVGATGSPVRPLAVIDTV